MATHKSEMSQLCLHALMLPLRSQKDYSEEKILFCLKSVLLRIAVMW